MREMCEVQNIKSWTIYKRQQHMTNRSTFSGLCRFHAYNNASTSILHFLDFHGITAGDRVHENTD